MLNDTRLKLSVMNKCQNCFSPVNDSRSPYMILPFSLTASLSLAVCEGGARGAVSLYAVTRTCRGKLP